MIPLPLSAWENLFQGNLPNGGLTSWSKVTSLVVDSRLAQSGVAFVALRGERTDGHLFIRQALSTGCLAIIAKKGRESECRSTLDDFPAASCVFVDEPLDLMAQIARAHLNRLPELYRIGVTGSNGKTTTKQMLASVFSRVGNTWASAGNYNSEIGLPMTSLGVTPEHQWGIFEMGINHPGEMDRLAHLVFPDLAVVTNIGTAHIGILGSQSGIALEKKKIFSLRGRSCAAILPADCKFLPVLTEGFDGQVELFGEDDSNYRLIEDKGLDGSVFSWRGKKIHLGLVGRHQVHNALAVAKVADVLGLRLQDLADGLEQVEPSFGRAQVVRGRVDLVLDCYNANWDSMVSLLNSLAHFETRGRKVLVLGSMKELGDKSLELHHDLGLQATQSDAQAIFWFGDEAEVAYKAALSTDYNGKIAWTSNFEQLADWLSRDIQDGDLVVLKGSRSLALERLVPLWFTNQVEKISHVL